MTTLAKAIIETASLDALRLRGRAYESLKAYELDPRKAVGDFLTAVRSDRGLMFELIGYAAARDRALAYLTAAAADMRHETEGAEAHSRNERQGYVRSAPSAPASDGGDAQVSDECRICDRSSPSETPRAPIPLPKRGVAELRMIKAMSPPSAFDSIRLRDNTAIGDLPWRLIGRYIRDNSYEAALLMKVRAYCVPPDPGAIIRDLIPPAEFDRMVQQAAQVAETVQ
jgi:hypothetical protein